MNKIITEYTREAGVRNLERIGRVCRKIARQIVSGNKKNVKIDKEKVVKCLDTAKYIPDITNRKNEIGIATGLAWTPFGGEVLYIESVLMKGNKGFILTWQLGDVMKESARAALSYLRSKFDVLKIDSKTIESNDIHIHILAGATPKDDPSTGVAIATSLTSLPTKRSIRNDVAMTGEINLRGKIIPVGGIREKVIAAKRVGIKTIIIPKKNQSSLEGISENILKNLQLLTVQSIDEVWKVALVGSRSTRIIKKNDLFFADNIKDFSKITDNLYSGWF